MAGRLQRVIAGIRRHGIGHVAEVARHDLRRRRYARRFPSAPPLLPDTNPHLIAIPTLPSPDLLSRRAATLIAPWVLHHGPTVRAWEMLRASAEGGGIVDDAERLARGRFTALGIGIVEQSENGEARFDWHRDYGSGMTWQLDRFDRIDYMSHAGADVKSVWELSRMYWIGTLGLATIHENASPSTHAATFVRLIDDWTAHNPFPYGVNWAMPMDAGIRAVWLVAGGAFFGRPEGTESLVADDDWWSVYYRRLYEHGDYLAHTLEYFPNLTNHYIADLVGLMVVGALFIDDAGGREWFDEGRRRLETELQRQVHDDGVHYELSLCYHGLVLELFLVAMIVAERAGAPFSAASRRVVERMLRFTDAYTPPGEGTIPQLGDSDDGRVLRLLSTDPLYDHRFLLDLGKRIGVITPIYHDASGPSLQELLLFGPRHDVIPGSIETGTEERATGLSLFPSGGFASMRTAGLFVVADVGAIGLHGNNDTLSFTLHTADGAPWIVDPGTGCYTRDHALRDALRSTAAHNAPMIDGREIAEFAGLWRVVEDRTGTRIVDLNEKGIGEDIEITLSAEHHAYVDAGGGGIVVERSWRVRDDLMEVIDRIQGEGTHHLHVAFTLNPDVRHEMIDATTLVLRRDDADDAIELIASLPLTIDETIYSPGYGIIQSTRRIVVAASIEAPSEITYLWRLHRSERTISPDERVSTVADGAPRANSNE